MTRGPISIVDGVPGIRTSRTATPRKVLFHSNLANYLPIGAIVDGAKSRDAGNTPVHELRAGLLMGRITASKKFAPAIIGVTSEALDSDETALDLPAAVVTEMTRRIGASGTFKITGPPTAGGTVRTLTATYSGFADSDTVTITALGAKSTWTMTDTDGIDGGTFRLKMTLPNGTWDITTPLAWNANAATIQAAIIATSVIGAAQCTVTSDTSPRTVAFAEDLGDVMLETVTDLTADGGVYEGGIILAQTVVGVDGRFIAGSFVQPTDGSETPIGLIGEPNDLRVIDYDGNSLDVQCPQLLIGGCVVAGSIPNYPTDTGLIAWLKAQLRAATGSPWVFSDDVIK